MQAARWLDQTFRSDRIALGVVWPGSAGRAVISSTDTHHRPVRA
jgi:hypothetical protein